MLLEEPGEDVGDGVGVGERPVGESVRLLVERRPRRVKNRSLAFFACSSSSRFFFRSSSDSCISGSGSFTRSITLPVLSTVVIGPLEELLDSRALGLCGLVWSRGCSFWWIIVGCFGKTIVGAVMTIARLSPGADVLGELDELSISSGESSSSSGRVGMLGSKGGRERVVGKTKVLSAELDGGLGDLLI